MKTLAKVLGIAAATLVSASAYTINHYTDVDQITGNNLVSTANNRITGLFNIVTGDGDSFSIDAPYYTPAEPFADKAGFRPGAEKIDSAHVFFYFRDNDDNKVEEVRINLDSFTLTRDFDITSASFSIFEGSVEGAIEALEVDGILKYNIIRKSGDFYFDYARLEVDAHVPDGGSTAILLGSGILALAAIRRRAAKQ